MCRSDGHREMPFSIMCAVKKRKLSSLGIHLAVVACRDQSTAYFAVAPRPGQAAIANLRGHENDGGESALHGIDVFRKRLSLSDGSLNQGSQRKTVGLATHGGWTFLSDFDCCVQVTVVRRSQDLASAGMLCAGLQTSHRIRPQVSKCVRLWQTDQGDHSGLNEWLGQETSGDRPQPAFIDRFRNEDYFEGTPFSDAPFCERRRISIRREFESVLTTVQNVRSFATASASDVSRSVM